MGMLVLGLTGCVNFVQRIEEPIAAEADVPGFQSWIDEARAQGGMVRLLVVHGMGHHGPGYSSTLQNRVFRQCGLVPLGVQLEESFREGEAPLGNLRVEAFGDQDGTPRVWAYEVTWSPVVDQVKRELLAFDSESRYADRRIWLNGELKRSFINDKFADPILYVGGYRTKIHRPLAVALRRVLRESQAPRDRLVAMGLSLGSRILFDTMIGFSSRACGADVPLAAEPSAEDLACFKQMCAREVPVWMLANPLPLLELGANPADDVHPPSGGPAIGSLRILALSDPNDLLTYPVSPEFLARYRGHGLQLSAVNISMHVEPNSILGLVVNPLHAHTDHDANPAVLDLLAKGWSLRAAP